MQKIQVVVISKLVKINHLMLLEIVKLRQVILEKI